MTTESPKLKVVITAEQMARRVRELACDISADYRGKTLYAVGVLENGFMFMADLVRLIEVPVVCLFLKAENRQLDQGAGPVTEIFYRPDVNVRDQHVLLIEGIIKSGIPQDFLLRHMMARQAASVRLATLLDKKVARRMGLEADYSGFPVEDEYFVGYGLGSPLLERNLPHIAVAARTSAAIGAER